MEHSPPYVKRTKATCRMTISDLKGCLCDRGLKTKGTNQMGVDTERNSIEEKVKNKQDS